MNLKNLFISKNNILSVYFTAGYPNLNDTTKTILSLQKFGADIIEVGIPYSDPLADGETIQNSSSIALKNGITLDIVFDQLNAIKNDVSVPLVIMGYLNQMLIYGVEKYLIACKEAGVEALIIPDLPPEEYETEYKALFEKHMLQNIFLITPQTVDSRIRKIDELSNSFIYMVSSSSITGVRKSISDEQKAYFERIQAMNLKNPALIGFGISDKETFDTACQYASGAIIGSAFIKAVSKAGELETNIQEFIESIQGKQ
jgi:tryptophan synthase alpha chain